MHQPTFVNLIRDPISWFQSHYTFMRFGMNKGRAEDAPKLGSVSKKDQFRDSKKIHAVTQALIGSLGSSTNIFKYSGYR